MQAPPPAVRPVSEQKKEKDKDKDGSKKGPPPSKAAPVAAVPVAEVGGCEIVRQWFGNAGYDGFKHASILLHQKMCGSGFGNEV